MKSIPYRESERGKIASFLQQDRIWAGYAICDLEDKLFPLCEWHSTREDDKISSLCLYFKGLDIPTQITFGDPTGIGKILQSIDSPERAYLHIPAGHREIVERFFSFKEINEMGRMWINKDTYQAVKVKGNVNRLSDEDLPNLEKLYAAYPKAFFRPYMLTSGVYYGFFENGEIVATAGTHALSPTYGMACMGNVFTRPPYRGRGYATACASAVVAELLSNYQDIILNVNIQNSPAVRIYHKLGFRDYCPYLEAFGQKRH
jgi:ribosomal protein S18 acetylase RimI-like enzyme